MDAAGGIDPAETVVRALADGRPRCHAGLARECGIDAAALDGVLERFSRLGVELVIEEDTIALPRPVDLLDAGQILHAVSRLPPEAVHLRFAVDSTNTVLAKRLRAGATAPELCSAEIQQAGRGRHGRRWVSALGQSVVVSVSWRFTARTSVLGGLSLAVGAALAEALAADGFESVMLKWPNDLMVDDRKLAGILVEASHSGPDSAACVIGVGFNLHLAPMDGDRIDRPWTDFAQAFGRMPARSRLVSQAANAILDACEQYRDSGLAPFAARWGARDALRGRRVRVQLEGAAVQGWARGIDDDGALLIEHAAGIARCEAGEVTVRAAGRATPALL